MINQRSLLLLSTGLFSMVLTLGAQTPAKPPKPGPDYKPLEHWREGGA